MVDSDTAGAAALRPRLEYARYVDLIEVEATGLAADIAGADLATPVPSCPGWNLAQLTEHVGAELAWVEGMVRSRATEMADDTALRRLDPAPERDTAATARWIADGGAALAATLRRTTADAPMWSPFPGEDHVGFHARRFAHEGALHRADAALALGKSFTLGRDVALDAVAEWMEHGQHPVMNVYHPERRTLLDRVLVIEIDDVGDHPDAVWRVDLSGDVPSYRPVSPQVSDGPVAVRAHGPVLDVLLVLYRRLPFDALGIDGDRALLEEWLGASSFA